MTMHRAIAVLSFAALPACGGDAFETLAQHLEFVSDRAAFLADCSRLVYCRKGDDGAMLNVEFRDGLCWMGGIGLVGTGVVVGEDGTPLSAALSSWDGNAAEVRVCSAGQPCLVCQDPRLLSASAPSVYPNEIVERCDKQLSCYYGEIEDLYAPDGVVALHKKDGACRLDNLELQRNGAVVERGSVTHNSFGGGLWWTENHGTYLAVAVETDQGWDYLQCLEIRDD